MVIGKERLDRADGSKIIPIILIVEQMISSQYESTLLSQLYNLQSMFTSGNRTIISES
jgi:hypothetical protein